MGLFGGKNSFFNKPLGSGNNSVAGGKNSLFHQPLGVGKNSLGGGDNSVLRKPLGKNSDVSNGLTRTFGRNFNDAAKTVAIGAAGYYTYEYFATQPASASGSGTFATKTGALGVDTTLSEAPTSISSSSQFGLTPNYLSGSTTSVASTSSNLLGTETSFATKGGSSSFLSDFGSGALDFGKDLGKSFITASLMNPGSAQAGSTPSNKIVPSLADYGPGPMGNYSPSDSSGSLQNYIPIIVLVGFGLFIFKKQFA